MVQLNSIVASTLFMLPLLSTALPYNVEIPQENVVRDLEELYGREFRTNWASVGKKPLLLRDIHNDLDARTFFSKLKQGIKTAGKIATGPVGQAAAKSGLRILSNGGKLYRREFDDLDELSARDYEELYGREWNELDERSFKSFLNGLKNFGGTALKIGAKFLKRDPEGTDALSVREFDELDGLSARDIDDLNELSARDIDDLKDLIARNFEELYGREWNELDERSWKSFWNKVQKFGGPALNIAGKVVGKVLKRDPEVSEVQLSARDIDDLNELSARDIDDLKELISRNFEELYGREWNELDERSWKSFWNGLKKVGGTVLNIAGKVVKRNPEGSEELTVRELEEMLYGRDVEEREINDLD